MMITYSNFYDNYMNQSEDINKKTSKDVIRTLHNWVWSILAWIGSKWIIVAHGGSLWLIVGANGNRGS